MPPFICEGIFWTGSKLSEPETKVVVIDAKGEGEWDGADEIVRISDIDFVDFCENLFDKSFSGLHTEDDSPTTIIVVDGIDAFLEIIDFRNRWAVTGSIASRFFALFVHGIEGGVHFFGISEKDCPSNLAPYLFKLRFRTPLEEAKILGSPSLSTIGNAEYFLESPRKKGRVQLRCPLTPQS